MPKREPPKSRKLFIIEIAVAGSPAPPKKTDIMNKQIPAIAPKEMMILPHNLFEDFDPKESLKKASVLLFVVILLSLFEY